MIMGKMASEKKAEKNTINSVIKIIQTDSRVARGNLTLAVE